MEPTSHIRISEQGLVPYGWIWEGLLPPLLQQEMGWYVLYRIGDLWVIKFHHSQAICPIPSLGDGMFSALTQYDNDGKTPLEFAIENNHMWLVHSRLNAKVIIIDQTAFFKSFKKIFQQNRLYQVLWNLGKYRPGISCGRGLDQTCFSMLVPMVLEMLWSFLLKWDALLII